LQDAYFKRLGVVDLKGMKCLLKLTAFLSLWALFFGLVAMIHLWVSVLAMPNRWKIVSQVNRIYTLLLRSILNIRITIAGDEGQLERGGYVMIANHVGYIDGIVLASIFPIGFVSKKKCAVGRLSASGTFGVGRFSSTGSIRNRLVCWCRRCRES
jgi:hypothetical protein